MPNQEPIETMVVRLEADTRNLMESTEAAFKRLHGMLDKLDESTKELASMKQAKTGLLGFLQKLDGVRQKLSGVGKEGKKAFDDTGKAAQGSAIKMGAVVGVVSTITQKLIQFAERGIRAFVGLGKSAIESNADFELFAGQFETLLGSAEAAQQRLEDLAVFGIKTPFELEEVVEANRILTVFGADTEENMLLIGDAAAGVNQKFKEVSFWAGRMYDAIQSGRPFGEAAMRLQEMGILTGDARAEIEAMQKAGESGEAVWARFSELVGTRFAGNMDRLSRTLRGVISNLQDFAQNLLRIGGRRAFEEIKESAQRLLDILDRNAPAIERVADAFGEVAANVVDFMATGLLDELEKLKADDLIKLADSLYDMVENARLLVDVLSEMQLNVNLIEQVTYVADTLAEALFTAAQLSALTRAEVARRQAEAVSLQERGKGRVQVFGAVISTADEEARQAGEEAFREEIIKSLEAFDEYNQRQVERATSTKEATEATKQDTAAVEESVEAQTELIDIAKALATDLMDVQLENKKKLEELEQDHAKRLVDINEDLADDLAELAEDTAEQRKQIFEDARRDLAELERDTDEALADERDDFQDDERRATEDHLRDMRRLTEDYLLDLEDAVTARDARAVVDLQRRFRLEQQRREEDFGTRQGREREDQDERLGEIREDEARRRQEIVDAQAEQLQDLVENEAKKRVEIESSHAEQRTAALESYAERQADLDDALEDRLQAIARELADEETLDDEAAKRILEVLNDTFGVGGEIDQMMEDFAARRRQRMIVEVSFEPVEQKAATYGVAEPTGARLPPGASFQHGGSMIARKPTVALFGEAGPEVAQFLPLNQARGPGEMPPQRLEIEFSGSAPPGIRAPERDQIAAVLLNALKDTGQVQR